MRASYACTFAVLITLAACSGKTRPFADTPIEGLGGSSGVGAPAAEQGIESTTAGTGLEPTATQEEPLGGAPVANLDAPDDAVQSGASVTCEADPAACTDPDAGPTPPACVPGPRDCNSEADNDCDGQPDNVADDVCICLPGAVETCDGHPGLDGRGQCRAGTRTCVASEGNVSSDWGACEGAQGPEEADSCVPQDDGDCDGVANEGCDCVEGATQPCGPPNDNGVCQRGTQTCINGSFGTCEGALFGTARDCRSPADNDCDGRPDNTPDNICTCTIGSSEGCDQHAQDGVGPCRAGQRQCLAGQNNSSSFFSACTGAVAPLPRDSCTIPGNDANCNNQENDGCACVAGQGNAPCSDTPDTARCNAQGQCVACQSNADCSLISGGRNSCQAGRCTLPPRCGDGIVNGSEVCDGGASGSTELGACNPECNGFYVKRFIRPTFDRYRSDMGGISGADAHCADAFGSGWKALLVGGSRRATVTPFLADGQQDWVIHRYTHYYNAEDQLVWRTDGVPLLAVRNGRRENIFAPLFDNASGIYAWSGYELDWRTQPDDPLTARGTCQGWTSSDRTLNGTFTLQDLSGYAYQLCGVELEKLLCVEQ
jgi:hypothetical protein